MKPDNRGTQVNFVNRPALKRHVQRLVSGAFEPDDLLQIFIELRELKNSGTPMVRELGDFAAHKTQRNQGVVWQHLRDMTLCVWMHCMGSDLTGSPKPVDWADVPIWFGDALQASFNMWPATDLKKRLGRGKNATKPILKKLLARIETVNGKRAFIPFYLARDEMQLFEGLYNFLRVFPLFTPKELAHQLAVCLEANGLIDKTQRTAILAREKELSIFAVQKMQSVEFRDDDTNQVFGTVYLSSGQTEHMSVDVMLSVSLPSKVPAVLATVLFPTSISMEKFPEATKSELLANNHAVSPLRLTTTFEFEVL